MIDWKQILPSRVPAAIQQAERGRIAEAYSGNKGQFIICVKQPTVASQGWPAALWERDGETYRKVSETVGSFRPSRSRYRQMLDPAPNTPDPTFVMAWGDSEVRKKSHREQTMTYPNAERRIDEKLALTEGKSGAKIKMGPNADSKLKRAAQQLLKVLDGSHWIDSDTSFDDKYGPIFGDTIIWVGKGLVDPMFNDSADIAITFDGAGYDILSVEGDFHDEKLRAELDKVMTRAFGPDAYFQDYNNWSMGAYI